MGSLVPHLSLVAGCHLSTRACSIVSGDGQADTNEERTNKRDRRTIREELEESEKYLDKAEVTDKNAKAGFLFFVFSFLTLEE